jgi:hypothetical protein
MSLNIDFGIKNILRDNKIVVLLCLSLSGSVKFHTLRLLVGKCDDYNNKNFSIILKGFW